MTTPLLAGTPARIGLLIDERGKVSVSFLADDAAARARLIALYQTLHAEIEAFEQALQARIATPATPLRSVKSRPGEPVG